MKVFFVQFVFLKLERGALGWLELAVGLCLFDLCTHSENQHVYVHDFFSIKVNVLAMADQHLVAAVKAFRNCSPGGPESHKFLVADPDVLVENHEELCLELLQLERRMTISFLQSAIGKAFPRLTAGECTAWAQRLDAGLKHILLKKKQSTSGKKLNSSVWRIIQQLGPESPQAGVSSLSSSSRPSLASTSKKLFPPGIDPVLNAKTVLQKAKAALGDDSFEDEEMPDKSSASVVSVASSEQEYQQYFDNASMCMVRLLPSGQLVQSIMKPGENGFAVATFPPESVDIATELPNSLLLSFQESTGAKKKPSAKIPVKKRPAAALNALPVSKARNAAAPVEGDPFKSPFVLMYYKEPKHSWAIRQRGGNQLFQITCQHRPKENLKDIMLQAVKKLEAGEPAERVKEWCKSQRESI